MKNDNTHVLLNKSSSSLNSILSPYDPIQTTDTVPNSNYVKTSNNYKTKKQKYVYLLTQPSISSSVRLRKKTKKISAVIRPENIIMTDDGVIAKVVNQTMKGSIIQTELILDSGVEVLMHGFDTSFLVEGSEIKISVKNKPHYIYE